MIGILDLTRNRYFAEGVAVVSRYSVSLIIGVVLLLVVGSSAWAAPSVFGISGNILTPDDTILAAGAFNIAYHGVTDSDTNTTNFFAGNVGLIPNLEVGAAVETNGDSEVLVNGKYRLVTENANRPAVTVGVIDVGTAISDNPGIFLLLSKNLTPTAENVSGKSVGPVRGHIGVGGGVLKTIFASLDWTVTPKLTLIAEAISDSEFRSAGGEGLVNVGARFALTNDLRLDAGLIDFDDFTFGISYQALKF
jgi:hypothetical protein